MPYSTGAATDVSDLADKVRAFLLANGWTINRFDTQGSGKRLEVAKGTQFISTRWYQNETGSAPASGAGLYGCAAVAATGYSAAADWNTQAGIPVASDASTKLGVCLPLNSGAIAGYWLFTDAANDNVVIVVQRATGVYNYLGWGNGFTKLGAWTGGRYLYGCRGAADWTNSSSFTQGITTEALPPAHALSSQAIAAATLVLVDIDTVTGKFLGNYTSTNNSRRTDRHLQGCALPASFSVQNDNGFNTAALHSRAYNGQNSGLVLYPCELTGERTSGLYSPIGSVPLVYATYNEIGGFAYGSEFTLGADTYLAFPLMAVKKVP